MRAKMDELGIPGPRWFVARSGKWMPRSAELGGVAIAKHRSDVDTTNRHCGLFIHGK